MGIVSMKELRKKVDELEYVNLEGVGINGFSVEDSQGNLGGGREEVIGL